jgi:hypothetical protein
MKTEAGNVGEAGCAPAPSEVRVAATMLQFFTLTYYAQCQPPR